jgi:hypothetical protein
MRPVYMEGGALLTKILALIAFALSMSSSALAAAGGCHTFTGNYTTQTVPCVTPAITCVEAQLTGDLEGTSLTVVTGFDPATQVVTGTATNFLTNGAVIESTFARNLATVDSVFTFTGGTRQYAHATGTLRSGGGTYAGEYCLGVGDDSPA